MSNSLCLRQTDQSTILIHGHSKLAAQCQKPTWLILAAVRMIWSGSSSSLHFACLRPRLRTFTENIHRSFYYTLCQITANHTKLCQLTSTKHWTEWTQKSYFCTCLKHCQVKNIYRWHHMSRVWIEGASGRRNVRSCRMQLRTGEFSASVHVTWLEIRPTLATVLLLIS